MSSRNRYGYVSLMKDVKNAVNNIPSTFEEAINGEDRDKRIETPRFDYISLNHFWAWILVERAVGGKIIWTKWVFNITFNGQGEVDI